VSGLQDEIGNRLPYFKPHPEIKDRFWVWLVRHIRHRERYTDIARGEGVTPTLVRMRCIETWKLIKRKDRFAEMKKLVRKKNG
jgi:hypothetical protein